MSTVGMALPSYVASATNGGGGAPGTSEVIVPNEAAASALLGLVDGQQVFIKSHRSWWRFNANYAGALIAHVVIASASAGASPKLMRTAYSDPKWRLFADCYVDPSNVSGVASDEGEAFFLAPQVGIARAPLLTWQEFFRRVGHRNVVATTDNINSTLQIHVLSSEPAGAIDAQDLDFTAFVDTYPRILGEANTVLLAGVLTTFTAQNPAVPAPGGTPCSITVGATVWAPYIGKRIRFTASGAVATILKDLGAGSARISQPQTTNELFFALSPTNVNPPNGAAFVIEDLVKVNPGRFHFDMVGSAFGFFGQMNIVDINLTHTAEGPVWEPTTENDSVVILYQCVCDVPIDITYGVGLNGCTSHGGIYSDSAAKGFMYGGACVSPTLVAFVNVPGTGNSGVGVVDFFTYFQGFAIQCRQPSSVFGSFAVFDAPIAGVINPGGHGVLIGGGPGADAGGAMVALRSVIFGSGSVGKGMRVASGSEVSAYGVLPNVTGATGDFQLGDDVSAIPLYDTPSYVYARVVDAQVIGNATDVALQAATSGNLVIASPTIALVVGKTYRLRAELRGDTTTLGETLDFAWVDAGTNAELIANTGRGQISNVATNAAESYGVAEIIYKPAVNQTVKLRCIAAVIGGTTTIRQITGRLVAESLFEFPIACTWANLAATVAAGGFGGGAHNPRQNAHIVQAAAT